MTTAIERKTCPDCHRVYYSWGAHAEECPGPMQRIADPPVREPDPCDCGPGAWHEMGCPVVVAPARKEGT